MNKPRLIRELLADHFGPDQLDRLAVLRARFAYWMRPDVQQGLERELAQASELRFFGARLRRSGLAFRFADLIEEGSAGIAVGPPVHDEVEIGEVQPLRCLQRGLWLAIHGQIRIAALLDVTEGYRRTAVLVEFAAAGPDRPVAEAMLARLRQAAERAETWRGKVLAAAQAEYAFDEGPTTLCFARLAPAAREDIVLAPGALELIERNTLEFARRRESLLRLGMSGRKGVLLYGPPGTGKTLLVRYLVGALEGHTKFLVAADAMNWLSDILDAAKQLAPSLVVIEDVDLVGADRDGPWQQMPARLNQLLNEMDGVGPEARVMFLLTTNRPEVLEPALAARPGRVDQAIAIGLPEERERRVLLCKHANGTPIADGLAERISRRIGKVSPAFIKELVRRAAQAMLQREAGRLEDADFERALEDMLGKGGKITARMLGAEGIGFASQA